MEFTFSYKLQSCDGFIIEVKREVIRQSSLLDNMLRDLEMDDDDEIDPLSLPIVLPRISRQVLQKVIEWCDHHKHDGPFKEDVTGRETFEYQIPTWDLEYFNIDKALLYQIIMAANYLEIRGLLELGHKHIALMMKGKRPEEIRTIFNVTNDFTPEEETEIHNELGWCLE